MEIKTIVSDFPGDFDEQVNAALKEGWFLTKRDIRQTDEREFSLYAELTRQAPSPIDGGAVKVCECCGGCTDEEEVVVGGIDIRQVMSIIKEICRQNTYCPECPIYEFCHCNTPDTWNV